MVISSVPKYGKVCLPYPARLSTNDYGNCLVASDDLGQGEIVGRFEGPVLTLYAIVPPEEVCYTLVVDNDHYMLVQSDAKYVNHSCDPNCDIDDDYYVVTLRPIRKGEEFSIRYNEIPPDLEGEEFFWDPRWSFKCRCGAQNCIHEINNYVVYDKPQNDIKNG